MAMSPRKMMAMSKDLAPFRWTRPIAIPLEVEVP